MVSTKTLIKIHKTLCKICGCSKDIDFASKDKIDVGYS